MVLCLVIATRYEEKQHVIESINILSNPEKAIIQAPTTKNQHPFPNRSALIFSHSSQVYKTFHSSKFPETLIHTVFHAKPDNINCPLP
jgi:hypothetical protein